MLHLLEHRGKHKLPDTVAELLPRSFPTFVLFLLLLVVLSRVQVLDYYWIFGEVVVVVARASAGAGARRCGHQLLLLSLKLVLLL